MTVKAGKALKIKIDGNSVVGVRSKEMSTEAELAEATTEDSPGDWKEYISLQKGATISVEGLYNPDLTGENLWNFLTKLDNGTKATAYYGGIETGDKYREATVLINSVTHTGEYSDLQNYSVEMTVTGQPETKTVSS